MLEVGEGSLGNSAGVAGEGGEVVFACEKWRADVVDEGAVEADGGVSYPDVVVVGTTATASETVANTSSALETLTLTNTLTGSNGTAYAQTQIVTLAPGETFTQSYSTKVKRSDVGSYTLTFTASDGSESATVAATFTVVTK